jgi:glycosyltransferase involved in cell wall biosynthesis
MVDTSDRRPPDNIGKFDLINVYLAVKHICQCFLVQLLKRPAILYLGISQSIWGYLRDLGFIIPALLMHRKVVVHLRGSEFGSFYSAMPMPCRWLTRAVFRRVSRVIILGQNLRQIFKGLVRDERLVVIPNGIDYQQFDRVETSTPAKTGDKILHLSSLKSRKGTLRLIEALPDILARHPEVKLTFAGHWRCDVDRRRALEFMQTNGLADHVTFMGEVVGAEKIQLYKQHDIFVFTPIEPEGLPWVVLEAMSAGLPVVTSNQGAIPEVVEVGQTGYIVEPEPKEVAEKVCYLLDHPEEARIMGLNGRRRIELHFSETAYLKAMEQVFWNALHI